MGSYRLFSKMLFKKYLDLDFVEFTGRNTSQMSKAIVTESQELGGVLSGFVSLLSELLVAICFYAFLLYIDFKITIAATLFIGLMLFIVFKTISKKVVEAGKSRNSHQESIYKTVFEALNNIRVIKYMGNRKLLMSKLEEAANRFSKAYIFYHTARNVPRYLLETTGFSLVVFIVLYVLWAYEDPSSILTTLGAFAIALYRLLPSASRMALAYNQILFHKKSLEIIEAELQGKSENIDTKEIKFDSNLTLKAVSFSYPNRDVLKNVNINIKKGQKVGFVGPSGAGKSTLVDLLTGLLPLEKGSLLVDGTPLKVENLGAWRRKTGYIPQSVFLFDGTALENISFGRKEDSAEMDKVLKSANLQEFLSDKEGLNTHVGDFGAKLSGGQRQRIGIARALYGNPEILVMDEATSSLDEKNAKSILEQIITTCEGKTLLAIVHDVKLLKDFDVVYEVDKNGVKQL